MLLSTVWFPPKRKKIYIYSSIWLYRGGAECVRCVGDGVCYFSVGVCVCPRISEDGYVFSHHRISLPQPSLKPSRDFMNLAGKTPPYSAWESDHVSRLCNSFSESFTVHIKPISTGIWERTRWPRPRWARRSGREAASDCSPRDPSSQRGGPLLLPHLHHTGEFKEEAHFCFFSLEWKVLFVPVKAKVFSIFCACVSARAITWISSFGSCLFSFFFSFLPSAVSMEMHICLVGETQRPTECVGTVNIDHNTIYWVRYIGQLTAGGEHHYGNMRQTRFLTVAVQYAATCDLCRIPVMVH